MSINSAILIGNLTRDPELRYSTGQNQMAICKFSIAVNDGYGEKQRTNYINIVVFGKTAESCGQYLSKGKKVCIRGHIQTGSYDHKDGYKVYTTDVIADQVEFLTPAQQNQQQGYPQQQPQQQYPPQYPQQGYAQPQENWPPQGQAANNAAYAQQQPQQPAYDVPAGFEQMAEAEQITF